MPEVVFYLWGWFQELNAARGNGGMGPAPISYSEIRDWADLTGRQLAAWEVRQLRLLDQVCLADPKKLKKEASA